MTYDNQEELTLGALVHGHGVDFRVWAPEHESVALLLEGRAQPVPAVSEGYGYHAVTVAEANAGTRYNFSLDGGDPLPDPASRYQPDGVHGPSEVVDPGRYEWRNQRQRPAVGNSDQMVIYEMHIGTFTPEGTFRAAGEKLRDLAELGVSCIELMPVADFPGRWNWGYDPGAFFAPSRAYGTPDDLRWLVDEAHGLGLAVILDVVYNHFGPDGAYLPAYSEFTLTSRHATPWGQAVDFDGPYSEGVRRFCIENALMWLREYRFDGLRLDATFAMVDDGPVHVLAELAAAVRRLPGVPRILIAEDPRNLRNLLLPEERGGLGLNAVWADDFHHQLRVRLAGDDAAYYRDFTGTTDDIARTITGNWFYRGHHSVNVGGPRGTPASDLPAHHFVYCIQNHDQVGNRPHGGRLNHDIEAEAYRAAAALLLFIPQVPMLFMGQEWAASAPFQFFTDHSGDLGRQVSEGRQREFAGFAGVAQAPDPQDPQTFARSRLDWNEREREPHAGMLRWHRDLLALRRTLSGPVQVLEVSFAGLVLRRSNGWLLLALEEGAELAVPEGALALLSSEDSSYTADPRPPEPGPGSLRFTRPGAVVVKVPA